MKTIVAIILTLTLCQGVAFADASWDAFQTTHASQWGAGCLELQVQLDQFDGKASSVTANMAVRLVKNSYICVHEVQDETSDPAASQFPQKFLHDGCLVLFQKYRSRFVAESDYCAGAL